jgi:hypothetical protein
VREGDFKRLVALLHPDIVLRADGGPTAMTREVRGAETVASQAVMWSRAEQTLKPALVNGAPGLVSIRRRQPFSILGFAVRDGRIVAMDILADPERLAHLDLTVLDE